MNLFKKLALPVAFIVSLVMITGAVSSAEEKAPVQVLITNDAENRRLDRRQ